MSLKTAAVLLLAASNLISAQQQDCKDYVLISVRGTYEKQGPSIAFPGMINDTLKAVTNGIEYDAVYPAAPNDTSSPIKGAQDIARFVTTGNSQCPQQKYAILGYSQGASSTALGLRNLTDGAAYDSIKAILVVGNPGHIPNSAANVDQNGGKTTANFSGPSYRNGTGTVIPTKFYDDEKVIDICYQADVVCAPAYPNASFVPAHLRYGNTPSVQQIGGQFLIKKLGANGSGNGTGGAPSIGSSSSTTTLSVGSFTSVIGVGAMVVLFTSVLGI